jgi:hypothetical protein
MSRPGSELKKLGSFATFHPIFSMKVGFFVQRSYDVYSPRRFRAGTFIGADPERLRDQRRADHPTANRCPSCASHGCAANRYSAYGCANCSAGHS